MAPGGPSCPSPETPTSPWARGFSHSAASHSSTPFLVPVARVSPSGAKATMRTRPPCARESIRALVPTSQRLTRYRDAQTRVAPSGEKDMALPPNGILDGSDRPLRLHIPEPDKAVRP